MNNDFKVIFFDLGNVLVHVYPERAISALAQALQKDVREIKQKWPRKKTVFEQFERGVISREQFYHLILDGKLQIDSKMFYEIYASIFELNEKTADIALRLSGKYRLSIISNTNDIHFEKIMSDYSRVMKLFEKPVTSFEAHSLKPEKKIFYYALEKLGCNADQAVFIDDKSENIQAANEIGMHAVPFVSDKQLATDLQKSGVNL